MLNEAILTYIETILIVTNVGYVKSKYIIIIILISFQEIKTLNSCNIFKVINLKILKNKLLNK